MGESFACNGHPERLPPRDLFEQADSVHELVVSLDGSYANEQAVVAIGKNVAAVKTQRVGNIGELHS